MRTLKTPSGISKEQEFELLLSLSSDFVSVRDKAGLTEVITARLRNLIGFENHYITILGDDGKSLVPYVIDSVPKSPNESLVRELQLSITDRLINESYHTSDPVCVSLDSKVTAHSPAMKKLHERDIQQIVIIRLSKGGEVFGFWFLFFRHVDPIDTNSLRLIKGISHQLSGAVSNVIGNDDIAKREQEKTRILAFSNVIASARDKNILARKIREHLHDIFGMIDYCVWLNSKDRTQRIPFLYDRDTPIARSPLFQQGLDIFTSSEDYLFQKALQSDEIFLLESKDWQTPEQPGYSYRVFAEEFKVKCFGANRIRLADEDLAVIVFSYDDINRIRSNFGLYRSICSQLAITLSNLLATEKVKEQLEEINIYKQQLEDEKIYLQEEIAISHNASDMIGESAATKDVFDLIGKVASSPSTVLILGETGTGKELAARAIHKSSPRRDKLMVKVNCAALPANLIESELFGHEKGSFTGAHDRRIGKFELANQGTLFLDEIGEMPLDLQVKLLRALQEKEIERVGGKNLIKVDVRIIAATNRNLEKEVKEGRFREDLYYRLNIFPICLPALRERKEDIPALVNHFVRKFSKLSGKTVKGFSKTAMEQIEKYSWPGNIRELEHFIERSILLATTNKITDVTLHPVHKGENEQSVRVFKMQTLDESDRKLIVETLAYCAGQISGETGAAKILGVPATTLHSKMKKLGIVKRHS